MKTKEVYLELKLEVQYDWIPAERQTADSPGHEAYAEPAGDIWLCRHDNTRILLHEGISAAIWADYGDVIVGEIIEDEEAPVDIDEAYERQREFRMLGGWR